MTRGREQETGRTPEMVIATFAERSEAEASGELLRHAGLSASVSTIVTPKISPRAEGADVKYGVVVPAIEARRAMEMLQDGLPIRPEASFELDLEEPLEPPAAPLTCPECGSIRIRTISTILVAAGGVALLATIGWLTGQQDLFYLAATIVALILVLGPNRRCLDCGKRWME